MIELYDGYYIRSDAYGYILDRHTGRFDKKTGVEVSNTVGFYTTIPGALKAFGDEKVHTALDTKESIDMRVALDTIRSIYTELEDFLRANLPEYTVVPKG